MKRLLSGLLCTSILILSMTACTFEEENPEGKAPEIDYSIYNVDDSGDKGPVKGGVLNLFSTEPDTLNPVTTKSIYVKDFLGLIYESLVTLDASQKPVPCIADRWEASEDGLVWEFHIRDGVKWHDGSTLTAADVEFTCNFIMNGTVNTNYKSNLINVASYAAIDSSNFRIMLKKPFSFMAEMMTFPILQKKELQSEIIIQQGIGFKPVGTGPYKFVSYNKGKSVKLVANDSWWSSANKEGTDLPNLPYIDSVEVKLYKNSNDAVDAFQDRETDILYIEGTDYEKYSARGDIVIKKFPGRSFDFIAFNLSRPLLKSKNVRNAINMGIDKEMLIKNAIPDIAIQADLPVIPGTWLENSAPGASGRNISQLEGLLKQDGFKKDNTGYYKYLNGVGTRLELELLVNKENKTRLGIAKEISDELAEAGININVVPLTWDEVFARIAKGKFDMLLTGIRIPTVPDISYLYSYPYIGSFTDSGYRMASNISGYSNASVNDYIQRIFSEQDETGKKALYINMKTLIQDEMPYIGLCFYNNAVVLSKRVRGGINPNAWNRFNGVATWYIP